MAEEQTSQPTMRQDASTGEVVAENPAAVSDRPKMYLKVYAPFRVYFDGDVYSVSATNATGPFDILPHHHNFLCMLIPGDLIIKAASGETKVIKLSRALMHVKAEQVTVFVDV